MWDYLKILFAFIVVKLVTINIHVLEEGMSLKKMKGM